ncbi:MAG: hypothetical protein HRU48_20765 [Vibrio sp.]|uniref:hypothetical protein n=1 Tax=Vibrio TaxID=662 RepID=UPI001EB477E0|nr:hypothetical protein [Vibrio sp.]NRB69766.1 hypothetical protein [Vibrio sp.]
MPACVDFTPEGFLKESGTSDCQAYVLVSSNEYADLSAHKSVSAQDAATAITFGFAVVFGLGFLTTYGVALAQRIIKLI